VSPLADSKPLHVALAAIAGIALIGYLAGTGGSVPVVSHGGGADLAKSAPSAVPQAVPYTQMTNVDMSRNANWNSGDLAALRPGADTRKEPASQAETDAALADRASNRAFAGAPPTIPHSIDQVSAASCLACHGEGLIVGERRASRISHPAYHNCTQCHVAAAPSAVVGTREAPPSIAVTKPEPSGGPRANLGAPPQMPHPAWMRQDCRSCHGPAGRPGLQTSHPERLNCQQCHTAAANSEQRTSMPPATLGQ
jgi:cytochrome c-type protein NapB